MITVAPSGFGISERCSNSGEHLFILWAVCTLHHQASVPCSIGSKGRDIAVDNLNRSGWETWAGSESHWRSSKRGVTQLEQQVRMVLAIAFWIGEESKRGIEKPREDDGAVIKVADQAQWSILAIGAERRGLGLLTWILSLCKPTLMSKDLWWLYDPRIWPIRLESTSGVWWQPGCAGLCICLIMLKWHSCPSLKKQNSTITFTNLTLIALSWL